MLTSAALHRAATAFSVRRVLNAMPLDDIDAGLTAFIDGKSGDWGACFFARAVAKSLGSVHNYPDDPTSLVADHYKVPRESIARVIQMFDNQGTWMSKNDLRTFILSVRDERYAMKAIEDLLATISDADLNKPVCEEVCCG